MIPWIAAYPAAPALGISASCNGGCVELRSVDRAQVRPEWKLARNAAFIIADRKLTQGINLDGGTNRYHEPMRLLTVIQAPVDHITNVIRRNAPVEQLFRNEWLIPVALDPTTKGFLRYLSDGRWDPLDDSSAMRV